MRENFVYMPRDGHCLFTCLLHILICLIYLQSFEKVTISTKEIFLIPKTGSIYQVHLVKNQMRLRIGQNSYGCHILNSEFITGETKLRSTNPETPKNWLFISNCFELPSEWLKKYLLHSA